ncbi:MAG TPA: DNA repair protein RecO C-terminal domain-containing protein, partial [Thermoguttaceae bacterium]|nr:DNA repair protein RecO C-terminal domain-containing protein [Thermoguttaceae bacterium]
CSKCRVAKRQVVSVSAGTIRTMAQFADPDRRAWQRMEIDPRNLGEMRGVLNHYLTNLLGKKPRMHQYLGMLWG